MLKLFLGLAKSLKEFEILHSQFQEKLDRNGILGPHRYPSIPMGDFDKSFQPSADTCLMTLPGSSS